MKRYKLIKEYPDSLKLGTIIDQYFNRKIYATKEGYSIAEKSIKDYPEFWEEVKEKDYEILSFRVKTSIYHVFTKESVTESVWNSFFLTDNVEIYSIKRLSDGEVFTIGDEVTSYGAEKLGTIVSILINTNTRMNVVEAFDDEKFLNKLFIGIDNPSGNCQLNCVIKIKNQKLFTTEDGVDIFKGDDYYRVSDSSGCIFNSPTKYIAQQEPYSKNHIHFSTKEKAEEYIIVNKPCLCMNDIVNLFNSFRFMTKEHNTLELVNLIKSKLNIK